MVEYIDTKFFQNNSAQVRVVLYTNMVIIYTNIYRAKNDVVSDSQHDFTFTDQAKANKTFDTFTQDTANKFIESLIVLHEQRFELEWTK